MMPSLPIDDRYKTRDSHWLATGRDPARIRPLDSQPTAPPRVPNHSCHPSTPPSPPMSPDKTGAAIAAIAHPAA
jgi:hypothetical protein